jgi:hypothetical protein
MNGGCFSSKVDIESREIAVKCIGESGDSIIELFDICARNNTVSIVLSDESSSLDWFVNVEYDYKYYLISTPEGKDADPIEKEFIRACEILGQLYTDYSVNHILSSAEYLEIRFAENSRVIIYSPLSAPAKDFNAEEIRGGFYTCMLKPMF